MTKYLNPKFHPKMLSIGSPHSGSKKLKRGRIVTDPNSLTTNNPSGGRFGVRFMYNPISVTAAHYNNIYQNPTGIGNSSLSQLQLQSGVAVQIGSASFSLLFDRTYEVYEGHHGNASTLGVYVDVLAFYELLGITPFQQQATKIVAGNQVVSGVWASMYPTMPINNNIYLDIFIGDKMKFFGYCDNLSITYTHWSSAMIPMRCEIDIDLQFLVLPGASKGGKIKHQTRHGKAVGGGHPMIPGKNKQAGK